MHAEMVGLELETKMKPVYLSYICAFALIFKSKLVLLYWYVSLLQSHISNDDNFLDGFSVNISSLEFWASKIKTENK